MNKISFTLLLFAVAHISCGDHNEKVSPESTSDLRQSLKAAESVYIYEGLPHPMFETALLKKERKRGDTTTIGGFPFYTPKTEAAADLVKSLRDLLSAEASIAIFTGGKRCGGFHPDYAIAWSEAGKEYSALICYGCNEVLFVTGRETYRYDLVGGTLDQLKRLLEPFAGKRPKNNNG